MIAYTFTRDDDGDLMITRDPECDETTLCILLTEDRERGTSGSSNVLRKSVTEMPAEHWTYFEWFDNRDGEYYRVPFETVSEAANSNLQLAPPDPLPVRSFHWPGMTLREAKMKEQQRQARRIAQTIKRMREQKAYREEQARLRAEEEQFKAQARNEMRSDSDVLEEAMRAEFGEDWQDYVEFMPSR